MGLRIAWPDRAPQAALSGGSWQTGHAPLTSYPLADVARTAGLTASATRFDADFGISRDVRFIALVRHNLSLNATVRVTAGSSAGGADLYDSGWREAWPAVRPLDALDWYSDSWWSGKLTDEERAQYPANYALALDDAVPLRYLRVEISDAANPDGFVEIGKFFAAGSWLPAVNCDWGYSIGWQDKTSIDETASGREFFGVAAQRRRASVQLAHMSTDEAMAIAFDMDGQLGVRGDLYYQVESADTVHAMRRGFLGRLEQLSPIAHVGFDRHSKPYQIIERIE